MHGVNFAYYSENDQSGRKHRLLKRGMSVRFLLLFLLFSPVLSFFPDAGTAQEKLEDVNELSLDELLDIPISTAAKYEQTAREAPSSVTVITAEDIECYGYKTLADAFNSVRGFYISDDRNYSYLGVRGFSRPADYNNRVLVLINGRPMNEHIWGSATIGTGFGMDLAAVERIEIARGPGSALYGTTAMFAVINIVTKTGNSIDGLETSAVLGSYGTREGAARYGREFENGLDVSFSGRWTDSEGQDLYYREYDDPATNNGIAQDLDWDKYYSIFSQVIYRQFTLQGHFSSRKKGIPTGALGVKFNDDRAKDRVEYGFLELKYDRELGSNMNLMLRNSWNHFRFGGKYPADFFLFADEARGNWVASELIFRWDSTPGNRLTIGLEYQDNYCAEYRIKMAGANLFDGRFPNTAFSAFIQNEYQVTEKLSLTLGVRGDRYSNANNATTPRGALVYHPTKSGTFKLLFGKAFRISSIYETNIESTIFGYKSNLDLDEETIRTVEAVWEQRLRSGIFGTLSLYNYTMRDLVDQVVDPTDGLFQFQNINQVEARGLELECKARMKNGLHGYASYVFQQAEDADSNIELTNFPSHVVKAGLSKSLARQFRIATEMRYETARTTVYETETDSYLITNVTFSAHPLPGRIPLSGLLFDHMNLSLTVRNLLDANYATPGGRDHRQPAIAQNGRNYLVRVDYEL